MESRRLLFRGRMNDAASLYVLSIFITVIGVAFMAALTGGVIGLMSNLDSSRERFRAKMDTLGRDMDTLGLPNELKLKIMAYYDYLWIEHKSDFVGISVAHDPDLNEALRTAVANVVATEQIPLRQLEMFRDVNDECIKEIVLQVEKPKIYMPGDVIVNAGQYCQELLFIMKGSVSKIPMGHTFDPSDISTLSTFDTNSKGDFPGHEQLIAESPWMHTLVAYTFVELAVLARMDLFMVLQEFPQYAHIIAAAPMGDTTTREERQSIQVEEQADRRSSRSDSPHPYAPDETSSPMITATRSPRFKSKRPLGTTRQKSGYQRHLARATQVDIEPIQEILHLVRRQSMGIKQLTAVVNEHGKKLRKVQASLTIGNQMQV